MGIGYDRHITGFDDHLTHVLVNDCLMRRNEDATGLLAGRLCVFMHIGIDGSAYRAQTVMTVGKDTRHREFFQSACVRGL